MDKIIVYWHDEQKTILRQVIPSGFSISEVLDGISQGRVMLDSVSHRVALLTEICQPFVLPKGYMNILRITAPNIRQNEVIHAVVGSPILIRSVLQLAARMNIPNLKYIRIADNLEHGFELCQRALTKTAPLGEQG